MKDRGTTDQGEAEVFFRQGRDLYERAHFESAIRALEKAVTKDPEHGLAQDLLLKARRWCDVEKAREVEGLAVQFKNRIETLDERQLEDIDELIQDIELALRLQPSQEEMRELHREVLSRRHKAKRLQVVEERLREGDYDGGVDLLESLVALDPCFADVGAKLEEASKVRDRLENLYTQARAAEKRGCQSEALELLEEVASLNGRFRATHRLLERLRKHQEGENLLGKAQALRYDGFLPEAFQIAQEALERLPHHVEAIRFKATLGRELGQQKLRLAKELLEAAMLEEALQASREALEYDLNQEEARLLAARLTKQCASTVPPESNSAHELLTSSSEVKVVQEESRDQENKTTALLSRPFGDVLQELSILSRKARGLAECGQRVAAAKLIEKAHKLYPGYKEATHLFSSIAAVEKQLESRTSPRDGVLLTVRHRGGIDKYVLLMKEKISIGRHESNDIILEDISTSRHHALIRRTGSTFVIEDLGSKNGTFIGGKQVVDTPLKCGDVIDFGGDSKLILTRITSRGGPSVSHGSGAHGALFTLSVSGKKNIRYLILYPLIQIGSHVECDIQIEDSDVVSKHASIRYSDGRFTLEPLASELPTILQGEAISESRPINFGDLLTLGKAKIYFLDYHY